MAEKIIKCIQCDKQFSTVKILRRHMLESHPANPDDVVQFSCLCCDKKFTRASNLQRHVHAMHNPNKVVTPPSSPRNANIATCALEMATVEEKTDNASKTHCCLTCGSKFRQLCHLKEHMLIHNGVKFSCVVCAKYFSRLRTWRSHMEKYHSRVGSSHSLDDDDDGGGDKHADTASCSLTSTESSTDSTSVSSGKISYPYGDSHSPFDEGSVYEHGFCAGAPHELQCESQFQCGQSLRIEQQQEQQQLQVEPAYVESAFLRACESIYCSSRTDEEGDITTVDSSAVSTSSSIMLLNGVDNNFLAPSVKDPAHDFSTFGAASGEVASITENGIDVAVQFSTLTAIDIDFGCELKELGLFDTLV